MKSSDFRKEARNRLTGKWGKAALIILCYLAITIIFNVLEAKLPETLKPIISILVLVVQVPLSFGLIISFLKLYKDQETTAFDFVSLGFNNFSKSWGVAIQQFLKLIVPFILVIVSLFIILGGAVGELISTFSNSQIVSPEQIVNNFGHSFGITIIIGVVLYFVSIIWLICKSYYYSLSYFIAAENENLTSKECVEKSRDLMTNNRAKLFWLQFSFIGWAILAVFTLGIGYFWLAPYMQFASIAFYKHLEGDNGQINVTE